MRRSLRTRLTIVFIGLAIVPLMLIGVGLVLLSFRDTRAQALDLEHQIAQNISTKVAAFIQDQENELRLLIDVVELQRLDRARQSSLLSGLLSAQNVYEEVALLDSQGQEEIRLSRLAVISADELGNRAGADEFERPKASGETYYSSVRFSEEINEPFMTIAVPLFDSRSGEFTGVLVADFRFKAVWDLMVSAEAGSEGIVYVVSESDSKVIAHPNPSVVLRGTQFDPPAEDGFYPGLDGTDVAMAVESIKLGEQEFVVVAEKPVAEVLALAINTGFITITVMAISLVIAGVLGFLAARQITHPIRALATTARAISEGEMLQQVEVTSRDEVGELAGAFNRMTIQLRDLIGTLEERIQKRTQRLEIVATLSERLSAILKLEELLAEVVNRIQESFGYYHAHIYLLDDKRENLVVAAGTGEAGAEMKVKGHRIPLDAPASLVARAARTGQIVRVDNVRETEEWLPNPLLPDTYSEMAVPIILSAKGQVVGVLDVQEDEMAGLDEGDAALLRSLANQVAVAIRNAHLFAEVETALAEAREVQRRFVEQAWDRSQIVRQGRGRVQFSLGESTTLSEAALAQARQQALARKGPAVVAINGSEQESGRGESGCPTHYALVASITLGETTIGNLQLHEVDPNRKWTENDLSLISAVVDQVAQVAENLRLLGETQERASREQLIGQISDRLRRAPDIETLMKTAVTELSRVLDPTRAFVRFGSAAELGVTQEKELRYDEPSEAEAPVQPKDEFTSLSEDPVEPIDNEAEQEEEIISHTAHD